VGPTRAHAASAATGRVIIRCAPGSTRAHPCRGPLHASAKIIGTPRHDFIVTGDGNDIVDSGGGNDTVEEGDGEDQIDCGTGTDTVIQDANDDNQGDDNSQGDCE